MNEEHLPEVPDPALVRLVDTQVLRHVVEQLRKDLGEPGLPVPPSDQGAFEALRSTVLAVITRRRNESAHALGVVLYRVDLPERQAKAAMDRGGLPELAGKLVLRTLQKVITRLHLRPPA